MPGSKGPYFDCCLTDAAGTSPFHRSRKTQVVPHFRRRKDGPLLSSSWGFSRQSQQDTMRVLQPSSSVCYITKTLNFKEIEGTSQWFCAHCPYLRAEWGKGLVHGPERYEPRETASHQHGASVQLQQDNTNTVISKSYSHWGLSRVLHGMSCNRETAKKHDVTLSSSQWRWELRKFWQCCSFPLFEVCTAKLDIT